MFFKIKVGERMDKDKSEILRIIKEGLDECDYVLSARIYGSWLHGEAMEDVDVAVMIPSVNGGVVDEHVYRELKNLRENLNVKLNRDVDLIPHTMDEIDDLRSTLWYPRYNPSLVSGRTVKGKFLIDESSKKGVSFGFEDLTAYILYDNRTICRRQLLRTLEEEQGRIFVSKLLHGPGNALTYYSCRNKVGYLCSPSDLVQSFKIFDEIYNVDSEPAFKFLSSCKKEINFEKAVNLMSWYENLLLIVLKGEESSIRNYQQICEKLRIKNG